MTQWKFEQELQKKQLGSEEGEDKSYVNHENGKINGKSFFLFSRSSLPSFALIPSKKVSIPLLCGETKNSIFIA